jgi:hypothetical protein
MVTRYSQEEYRHEINFYFLDNKHLVIVVLKIPVLVLENNITPIPLTKFELLLINYPVEAENHSREMLLVYR